MFWCSLRSAYLVCLLGIFSGLQAQTLVTAHPPVNLRGLSVADGPAAPGSSAGGNVVVWTSGVGGTVGRSTDGGAHWTWISVPGCSGRDFRDIKGFDANTAVVMAIDTPAVLLRTEDGGVHWTEVFRNGTPGMFLDAMDFKGGKGIVVGDPVPTATGNRFYLAMTLNFGRTWTAFSDGLRPPADSGEGCFASSGTNIRLLLATGMSYAFVSGGPVSRIFTDVSGHRLALRQGAVSTGANSIAIDGLHWVIVGGDFAHDTITTGNCLYSTDCGAHWLKPHVAPHGYRSCVVHVFNDTWLCCGTSGIDLSTDGGDHWRLVSRESYHVAAVAGHTVFLAGARGRVARLEL